MARKYKDDASRLAIAACVILFGASSLSGRAQAQNLCVPVLGGTACDVDTDTGASPIADVTGTLDLTVDAGADLIGSVGATATGAITLDAASNIVSSAAGAPALALTSLDSVTARVGGLASTGAGSAAALLRAGTQASLVAEGVLSTTGDSADGVNIIADAISVTADTITTVGLGSDGVGLVSLDGPITLDVNGIETLGDLADGAVLNAAGGVDLDVGVLRTGGNQALGLRLTTDPAACAVLGAGNCGSAVTIGNLLTRGEDSPGILATIAGPTAIDVDILETRGANSPGISVTGDPTACVLLGSGSCATSLGIGNLLTTGDNSGGIAVDVPALITADLGIIATQGDGADAISFRTDPQACATLGVGSCGIDLSATQVSTGGDGSAGIAIAAVGPITVDLGSVTTGGINSPAVSIETDPTVCAVLGAGECTTDVSVGSITTSGDGSAGLGILAGGPLTVRTGPVSTLGTDADGIVLAIDPTACVLVGAALCSADVTTGNVSTGGDGSVGIGLIGSGPIRLETGDISTLGIDAPGVLVGTNPAVCAVVGAGACSTDVTTGSVVTSGDGSLGVGVLAGGPTTVTTGPVTTGGNQAPGVIVITDPTACLAAGAALCTTTVTTGPVNTGGDDSPGVVVVGGGSTTITTGPITTGGSGSDGLVVALDPTLCAALGGANCTTTIDAGPIDAGGEGSGGVIVGGGGGGGTVVIITDPIISDGNGVDVDVGCTDVDYTARGPVTSRNGTAVRVRSACGVSVTTLDGAPVRGATGGIDVGSGTGATITIGDAVSSENGLAVNADGAGVTLINQTTGVITGRVDLTDEDDRFVNAGRFEAIGDSSFGGGTDILVNTGVIAVRPGAAAAGSVTFAGLDTLDNRGMIDMRNGHAGDRLTVPGSFSGSGESTLAVEFVPGSADGLVIGGAATGSTGVIARPLQGGLVDGVVVVDAGAGTSAGAFTLTGPTRAGIVDYSLVHDAGTNDFTLFGTPNDSAIAPVLGIDGARQAFYRSSDAVAAHLDEPRTGRAFWVQGYGLVDEREGSFAAAPFGQARTYSLDTKQDFYGVQFGADLLAGENGTAAGITAGYGNSRLNARASGARFRYDTWNAGIYGSLRAGPLQLDGLAKYERARIRYSDAMAGTSDRQSVDGYGGFVRAAVAFGSERVSVAPFVSLDYANFDFDDVDLGTATVAFDEADGMRGKAGARVDAVVSDGPSRINVYASGAYVHEFRGRDRMTLSSNGYTMGFRLPSVPDYGQARVGVAIAQGQIVSGFIEATGDFSSNYHGGGARGGLSIRF